MSKTLSLDHFRPARQPRGAGSGTGHQGRNDLSAQRRRRPGRSDRHQRRQADGRATQREGRPARAQAGRDLEGRRKHACGRRQPRQRDDFGEGRRRYRGLEFAGDAGDAADPGPRQHHGHHRGLQIGSHPGRRDQSQRRAHQQLERLRCRRDRQIRRREAQGEEGRVPDPERRLRQRLPGGGRGRVQEAELRRRSHDDREVRRSRIRISGFSSPT